MVVSSTTLAASSCSHSCISASEVIIAPDGADDRTRIEILKVSSKNGIKYTHAYANSGYTISFRAQAKYMAGLEMRFLNLVVDNLIPSTIMHIGVTIFPNRATGSTT